MTDRLNKLQKNCETCFYYTFDIVPKPCKIFFNSDGDCVTWVKNHCKFCNGPLVRRKYKGKTYYYCYSCHFEFERGLL